MSWFGLFKYIEIYKSLGKLKKSATSKNHSNLTPLFNVAYSSIHTNAFLIHKSDQLVGKISLKCAKNSTTDAAILETTQ